MVPSTPGTRAQVYNLEKAVPALAPQGQAHSLEKLGAQDQARSLEMVVPILGTVETVDDDMIAETIK
ncbi:hypothetical protein Tco_0731303 [Tanacetum coccineum]